MAVTDLIFSLLYRFDWFGLDPSQSPNSCIIPIAMRRLRGLFYPTTVGTYVSFRLALDSFAVIAGFRHSLSTKVSGECQISV